MTTETDSQEAECRVCGEMWTPNPDGRGHRCDEDAIDYLARIGELFDRAEAAEKRAREAEEKLKRLTWGVVANAGRLSSHGKARWGHVSDVTGFGSTSAKALCVEACFDADAEVGGSLGIYE